MSRRRKSGRDVNGILLLDKPLNMTSNEVLQKVKRLYQARKAGHTGSLDPLATGMLPICFGEATKVSSFLLDASKHYSLVCKLGQTTETGDREGKILKERTVPHLERALLDRVLDSFLGTIQQIPPMYSALKHQGQRLYDLARKGVEVERAPREVVIHRLDLLDFGDDYLVLDVFCSKGTYVRTLVEDIGAALDCGAHVTELRRLGVGPYEDAQQMVTLQQIEQAAQQDRETLDQLLLPIESALSQWPGLQLSVDTAYYLCQGQAVMVPKAPTSGWVRLYQKNQQFLGMGEVLDDGKVAPRRLFRSGYC